MRINNFLPYIVFSLLILSQIIISSFRINVWPFTSYEMFANKKTIQMVGAFRLKAWEEKGSTFYINLQGYKVNWKVYEQGIATNNLESIRNQMLRDLKFFEKNNQKNVHSRITKLTLVSTESTNKNSSNKIDLVDKEIYTIFL